MKTSVIIPTYRRSADLSRLLKSLGELDDKPDEIFVVIGPDDAESHRVAKDFRSRLPTLRALQATVPSVIHAMNIGFTEASGDIICLLDDDASVPTDWLGKIIAAFVTQTDLGAYGGRDRLQTPGNEALSRPEPARVVGKFRWDGRLIGNHHRGGATSPMSVDVIKGVNFSFRTDALKPIEINRNLLEVGAEPCWEVDICLRLKIAGYSIIYDNENWVNHNIGKRHNGDERTDMFASTTRRRSYNQFFVVARYRTYREIFLQLAHCLVLGSKFQPGIVRALILYPKYGIDIFGVAHRSFFAAVRGSLAGLRERLKASCTSGCEFEQT